MNTWLFLKHPKRLSLLLVIILHASLLFAQKADNNKGSEPANTSIEEDIHRYIGFESPLPVRYLSLPYDMAMTTNLRTFTVEIGFFLLVLLPLVFLLSAKTPPSLLVSWAVFLVMILTISLSTTYLNQHKLTLDQGVAHIDKRLEKLTFTESPFSVIRYGTHLGLMHLYIPVNKGLATISGKTDYVTYPILLALFGMLLVAFHFRLSEMDFTQKGLLLFFLLYGSLWFLLSGGLPWYGFLMFALGSIWMVHGWEKKREKSFIPHRIQQGVLYGIIGLWVFASLPLRMANYTPNGNTPEARIEASKRTFFQPLAMYRTGEFTGKQVLGLFRTGYPEAIAIINQETRSLIYQVGTLMPFYIKKNDARIVADPYLGYSVFLLGRHPDKQELINVFKASNFRYILVDLKLPQIDKTPGQTLAKKFEDFMNILYQNPLVELVATDRTVRLNSNGQVVPAVFFNNGKVVKAGSFALYRIK